MSKYLIFRTDRIGDFIFSRVVTESIKFNNQNNIIDFVCSNYNYDYLKNFKDIRNLYVLNKYNFKQLLNNYNKIKYENYDYIIILDGKRRSVFYSILLKSKNKIALVKDFRMKYILNFFNIKFFVNSEINSQYKNFINLINFLNLKVPSKINYFKNYTYKIKKKFNLPKNYTLLHLDEKWFEGYYYDDFIYMNLNYKNFNFLISKIYKKFKKKIVLTCGNISTSQFTLIQNKFFIKINNNYFYNNKKFDIRLILNTNFHELKYIVSKSSEVICCEGAISHVSNGYNIKTFALVNGLNTAKFWTNHMQKIKLIRRSDLKEICNQIERS